MFTSLLVNGKRVHFMLDCGSAASNIQKSIYDDLPNKCALSLQLATEDGVILTFQTTGKQTKIQMYVAAYDISMSAYKRF